MEDDFVGYCYDGYWGQLGYVNNGIIYDGYNNVLRWVNGNTIYNPLGYYD